MLLQRAEGRIGSINACSVVVEGAERRRGRGKKEGRRSGGGGEGEGRCGGGEIVSEQGATVG
jgi:hypothetical protein